MFHRTIWQLPWQICSTTKDYKLETKDGLWPWWGWWGKKFWRTAKNWPQKVEIKSIKETSLMVFDMTVMKQILDLLTEKTSWCCPTLPELQLMTSKVTRLAVDKIEEVEKDGKNFATKLLPKHLIWFSGMLITHHSEEYVRLFWKQKAKEGNVYYNFNWRLVKDMS